MMFSWNDNHENDFGVLIDEEIQVEEKSSLVPNLDQTKRLQSLVEIICKAN